MSAALDLRWDNGYARELGELCVPWRPAQVPAPVLLRFNHALAHELGWPADALAGPQGADWFSGNQVLPGAEPVAQGYAGHQFGHYSPQLGDGRALLLGEVLDRHGQRRDIAFKGSGRTPFSRGGDGKAALGPVLREYLMGEAMHALGIPTTRALAVAGTGEAVLRDAGALPGAVLTRVAASHIRVGTFQWVAARGDIDALRRLADHTIARHAPALIGQDRPYLGLLAAVAQRQAALVARWMGVGFIHGVMNTDNMALSGETIDYGPCAFMDGYDPATVFSSIDRGGRYAYRNQPHIARWNLARLAEALLPLIATDPDKEDAVQAAVDEVSAVIDAFPDMYQTAWLAVMRAKLGLPGEAEGDATVAQDWLDLLAESGADLCQSFRRLADLAADPSGAASPAARLGLPETPAWADWWARWSGRTGVAHGSQPALAEALRRANPRFIPRNLWVEEALEAATERGDLAPFDRLLAVLQHPFDEQPEASAYADTPPAARMVGYRTFCGT